MKTKDQLIQYLNNNVIPAFDFNQSTSKSIFNKLHTLCTDGLNAQGSTKEEALRSLIKPNGGAAKRNITKLKETLSTDQALDGKLIADYLATVIDLFSRRVVGWSMDKNIDKELVIKALLMAVYQRRPTQSVLVYSDQGSQYGSSDYLAFMKERDLVPSMSRKGNCHDNAVAESFLSRFVIEASIPPNLERQL